MPAERDDERGIEDLELPPQEWRAGRDLVGLGIAVLGRATFHDVRDEDLLAPPAKGREELAEKGPGAADERTPLAILVESGPLADEHDLRVGMALAGHGLRSRLVEPASRARPDLGRNR